MGPKFLILLRQHGISVLYLIIILHPQSLQYSVYFFPYRSKLGNNHLNDFESNQTIFSQKKYDCTGFKPGYPWPVQRIQNYTLDHLATQAPYLEPNLAGIWTNLVDDFFLGGRLKFGSTVSLSESRHQQQSNLFGSFLGPFKKSFLSGF